MGTILRKFWWLFVIGLLLRLFIAGTTFHPDTRQPVLSSAIFFNLGSLDFYSLAKQLSPDETPDDLPFSYLINLPFHLIARPLVDTSLERIFLVDITSLIGQPVLWQFLIYAKLPFVIFDLLLAMLLAYSVKEVNQKKATMLWIFNPISLWASSGVGQADIQPTLFLLASFLLIKIRRYRWAVFCLGIGTAIKTFPILLLPLILGLVRTLKERILLVVLFVLPLVITITPYLLISEFRQYALLAPQLSKSLFAKLSLSGGEAILLAPFFIIFFYLKYFSKNRDSEDFPKYGLVILLVILSLTHFHMQWFLWVMPLILILYLDNKQKISNLAIVGLFGSWLLMLFLFEASLQVRLFAPLFPGVNTASGLSELLSAAQISALRNLAATVFASSAFFIIWKILKNKS